VIQDVPVSKGIYLVTHYESGLVKYGFVTNISPDQRMKEQRSLNIGVEIQRRARERRNLEVASVFVDKYVSVTDIAFQKGDELILTPMQSTRYAASRIGIVCASIHFDREAFRRNGVAMIESRTLISPEVDLITVSLRKPVPAPTIINANISLG
jgi:hypothetical protein